MTAEPSWAALCVVTTTVASAEDARQLARTLLQARLAACVQTEPITSHYVWQQQLHEQAEWRVVIKTLPDLLAQCMQRVRDAHPYELPQLLVRTEQCLADYAHWVHGSLEGSAE